MPHDQATAAAHPAAIELRRDRLTLTAYLVLARFAWSLVAGVASLRYVVLIGVLSLAAALHAGWRVALVGSLVVALLAWSSNRRPAIDAPPPSRVAHGRLPGVFWIAAAMLFCTTAAEWCITAWSATFVEGAAHVSADTAIGLMAGYLGGVAAGRTLGSRLARRHDPALLLAFALAVTGAGFAILWASATPAQALAGLSLLGIGLGNLFPLGSR